MYIDLIDLINLWVILTLTLF